MVKYVDSDKKYYLHEGKLEYLSLSLKGDDFLPETDSLAFKSTDPNMYFHNNTNKLCSYDIYVGARKCQNTNYAIINITSFKFKFKLYFNSPYFIFFGICVNIKYILT